MLFYFSLQIFDRLPLSTLERVKNFLFFFIRVYLVHSYLP